MKLIFCKVCEDVVKCTKAGRKCQCGASGGQYLDDLNAVYWGEATPLGFANSSLLLALRNQPQRGDGKRFDAFVIPWICPTFKKVNV